MKRKLIKRNKKKWSREFKDWREFLCIGNDRYLVIDRFSPYGMCCMSFERGSSCD